MADPSNTFSFSGNRRLSATGAAAASEHRSVSPAIDSFNSLSSIFNPSFSVNDILVPFHHSIHPNEFRLRESEYFVNSSSIVEDLDYEEESMSFVTNLFDRCTDDVRDSDSCSCLDPCVDSNDSNRSILGGIEGIAGQGELNFELGLGLGLNSSRSLSQFCESHSVSNHGGDCQRMSGLRVVSIDSESDSEGDGAFDGFGTVSNFVRPPFCWDELGFDDERNNEDGVGDGNDEMNTELSSIVNDHGDGDGEEQVREFLVDFDSDAGGEEEIEIGQDSMEEAIEEFQDLEWEISLAMNNFVDEEAYDMDSDSDEYDAVFSDVEEHWNEHKGGPPASKSFVENLPIVELSRDRWIKGEVVCAICVDEVSWEETVRKLPCCHYYHGDCILPWLSIRNTCPVCRHELPTDDPEYEFFKRERDAQNDGDSEEEF